MDFEPKMRKMDENAWILPQNTGRCVCTGIKPFCGGLPRTHFFGAEEKNPGYMAFKRTFLTQKSNIKKMLKIMIFDEKSCFFENVKFSTLHKTHDILSKKTLFSLEKENL